MADVNDSAFRRLRDRLQANGGFIELGAIHEVPVRVHWTAPFGALLCSVPTGFHFAPGAYLGFVLVILVHELGHAGLVRLFRGSVFGIDVTIVGGECHWAGRIDPLRTAAIAWGGILAQLALLAITARVAPLDPYLRTDSGADLLFVLIVVNFFIALANLLPLRGLDGVEAWKLVPLVLIRLLPRVRWVPPDAPFASDNEEEDLPPLPREIYERLDEITKGVGDTREKARRR